MSNFFSFENDIDITEYPFDPSVPFRFKAYKGTPFFSLNGRTYPETSISIENIFVLPKGTYLVQIDADLKGRSDKVALQNISSGFYEELSSEPKEIIVEEQIEVDLVFVFDDITNYFFGDNYKEQEDYGKDYCIKINVLSGGLYDRKKFIAILKGDTTEDGTISKEDMAQIDAYIYGADFENVDMFRYDVNQDGVISGYDNRIIAGFLEGTEALYDVEYFEDIKIDEEEDIMDE